MKKQIEITEQELKDLKAIRNYFGEHDKTMFEHKAYVILNRLIKSATFVVGKYEGLQGRDLLIDFKKWEYKNNISYNDTCDERVIDRYFEDIN